jgi:hypothetical protein
MGRTSLAFGLALGFLLLGAAIVANVDGRQMPEMRGAWITQAMR